MMRVLLLGNYRQDGQYSMLGFEKSLLSNMPRSRVEYVALHPEPVLGHLRPGSKITKWLAYLDKFVLFPACFQKHEREVDLVHLIDHGNSMWVPKFRNRPVLITCHDLLAMRASLGEIPGWTVGKSGRKFQELIARGIGHASHVACVSTATWDDFGRILRYPAASASVVYNGLFDPGITKISSEEIRSCLGTLLDQWSNGFLLHVGGNQPYKNRTGLLSIYSQLVTRLGPECPGLVLAGHQLLPSVRLQHRELFETGRAVELVTPDTRTIWALYSAARCLVYPSLLEGFGLPLLEAQACGCPVVSSNRASLPEVGGQGALYFDPEDIEEAVETIIEGLTAPEDLVARGTANLGRFTTERMVNDYADLYESILSRKADRLQNSG